jgi:hydroxymethylglutaryl-CoA lyase
MPCKRVEIVEVAARDGLQNEKIIFSTAQKVALIRRMVAAGARRIEVASFARPDRVPQMADAEAVIAALDLPENVITIGLVMNKKGAFRALETGVRELGAVAVASDTFAQRNQGQTSLESAEIAADIVRFANSEGRRGQATIGAAFGCPFEGEVDPAHVVAMARQLAEANPVEIALADTIGAAVPAQVFELVSRVREAVEGLPVRVHLHNTRGTGIANAWAAFEAGATTLDASLGGIGGCPFAPNATGNIATEDLLYMFERSGVKSGYNLDDTIETARWLGGEMGRELPGLVSRAGNFPKPVQG